MRARLNISTLLLSCVTGCSSSGSTTLESSGDAGPKLDAGSSDAPMGSGDANSGDGAASMSEAGQPSDGGNELAQSDAGGSNDAGITLRKASCSAPMTIDSAPKLAHSALMRSRPDGNIAVTWQEIDAADDFTYRDVVRAFVGGTFAAPHTLTEDAATRSEAAIDDQGNIHAHWAEASGSDREREDYDASNSQWSGKQQWFTNKGSEITLPLRMFALNASGLTLHTMFYNDSGSSTAAVAVFDPASGWSAIHPLEAAALNTTLDIPVAGLNDAGQGVVVWGYTDNTTGKNLHSFRASTFSDATFAAPVSVMGGTGFYDAAVLSNGDAVLVYANTDRVSARRFVRSAGGGGTWAAEQTVDMMQPGTPTLVVDAADNVTAVWLSGQAVRAARYEGGTWQPAEALGITDLGHNVALDRFGNVSVVYRPANDAIKIRRMAATGGAWTGPVNVANETGTIELPMVAHDGAGNVAVAYALGRVLPQGGTDSHIRWVLCE